ncbi:MAG TPA: hypothetical protein VF707_00565 [Ardenticatenaceae bacterium]|jgi:hypothetical protein
MDPITILITALAAGAAAALQERGSQAVKDAYSGLKGLLQQRYSTVNVEQLEQGPEVPERQEFVKFELANTEAPHDEEVLREAQRVFEAVKNYALDTAEIVGVSLEEIDAASIRLQDIIAQGSGSTGVSMRQVRATGDIDIQGVRAENSARIGKDRIANKTGAMTGSNLKEGERKWAANHGQELTTDKLASGIPMTEQQIYALVYDQVRKLNLVLIDLTKHLRGRLDYLDQLDKPVEN